jgi:hypothetical protein
VGTVINYNWVDTSLAFILAILLREARVQTLFIGIGSAAPSFAALLASLLPRTFKCLRT